MPNEQLRLFELLPPGLTTNRNDPRLSRGVDREPVGQSEVYLVLSEEERQKGFVRPVRLSYVHVGPVGGPAGCGAVTMNRVIAETYARDPGFYGATYCCHCRKHLPVGAKGEFVWDGSYDPVTGEYETERVGT